MNYTFVVNNTGDDPLSNVSLTDMVGGAAGCTPVYQSGDANNDNILDTDETWTYTCTGVTINDDTTNVVTVTGDDSLNNPVTDNASAFVDVVAPAMEVVKTANPTVILAGDQVKYTYQVRNTGDTPLVNIDLSDNPVCVPLTGPDPAGDTNNNGLLDPGEVWTYTCTTSVAVDTTNTITVTADPSDPNGQPLPPGDVPPLQETDDAIVTVVDPDILLTKSVDKDMIYAGETVLYTYKMKNTGDVPLANPTISDDTCSPLVYQGGDDPVVGILDVDEIWTYTCSMALGADTTNVAVARGQPSDANGQPLPGFLPVDDTDSVDVDVINPAIKIVKTADQTQITPPATVTYTYEVTNPGDDPLANVTVSDDKCSPVTGPAAGGDANNNGFLDPGETWVYECSHNFAVDDPDTLNTATATGDDSLGNKVRDTDTEFVDVITVGLHIEKSANPTTIYNGDLVTYTYEVTNTGDNAAYHVNITDDKCSPVLYQSGDNAPLGVLAPNNGETWIYICTTRLRQDTTNTATVTGKNQAGASVDPDDDTADVNVINPVIKVVKDVDKSVVLSGETVVYSYTVTNPGDDPLSDVSVTDNKCSPLNYQGGDANGDFLLDPGEVWTYICTATIATDTTNVVTATGKDSKGNPVTDNGSEFVDVIKPSVKVIKSADPLVVLPGQSVQYTYLATNTGDTPLSSVGLIDDKCAPILGPTSGDVNNNGLLDPGESWTYTCTTTVNDDTTNKVLVSGQPSDPNGQPLPGIDPVGDDDTEDVDVVHPAIHIVKTADPAMIYAGETVVYTYKVTNPGDTPLANPNVTDDKCAPVLYQSGDGPPADGVLQTNETWIYTCTTAVHQDTVNTAIASGQPADPDGAPLPGLAPVTDDDIAQVDVINPDIEIVKVPSATNVQPGELVIYTFYVTNTGDTPLANVAVLDDKCGVPTLLTVDGNGLLDPGETWVYQCTQNLDDDTTNVVTVTADDPLGSPVHDDDSAFVNVLKPGLTIDKVVDKPIVNPGDTVIYTYYVRNTGTDPAYNVDVTDDTCSPVDYDSGDDGDGILQPGETWVYECTMQIDQDTVNVAVVTGTDEQGNPVPPPPERPDEDSETVNVINPAIDVVKDVDRTVALEGDQLLYLYRVSNPGDDPISNVTVTDNKCSPLIYQSGDLNNNSKLDPGETWFYTCTYIVKDTDPDPLVNIVDVSGDDSLGNPVTDDDTKSVDLVQPDIILSKVADRTVVLPGDIVVYTYEVENPGDTPIASPTVTDDTCSPVNYQSGDDGNGLLEPGEIWIYTCTTAIVVDTTNTATTTGQPTDPNGGPLPGIPPVTSPLVTEDVTVVRPGINVEKSADLTVIHNPDDVTYTYLVTTPPAMCR